VIPAPDVMALGETMLSLIAVDGTLVEASTFRATHGGAESNTCVWFTRRRMRAALVSRLGADLAGDRVIAGLERSGVDVRWVRRDPDRPTGLMLRDTAGTVRYWRTGSAASALEPEDLDDAPVADARSVLVSGITPLLGPGPHRTAIAFLDRAHGLRAVDPHVRPGLWGSDRAAELVRPLVERCHVVLGGAAELTTVLAVEGETPDDDEALARLTSTIGPTEVVLKRGANGAAALAPDGSWHVHRPPPVADVDPVGAGDAFNAAYLAVRLGGGDVPDALAAGAAIGAAAASTFGDTAESPTAVV
jgi:2-dehydro-3-deoxygluconokinase